MKRICVLLWFTTSLSTTLAQGLVNFFNNSMSLVSAWDGNGYSAISGRPDSYYFALLIAPEGTTEWYRFTFSGVYATNQPVAGRLGGGFSVAVPAWVPGSTMNYEIVGWPSYQGPFFDQRWISGGINPPAQLSLGISSIGSGVAGGNDLSPPIPPLNLFGGAAGIQTGFSILPNVIIPEPSAAALAVLSTAMLLSSRRAGKRREVPREAS
jgi:hypothetical protein